MASERIDESLEAVMKDPSLQDSLAALAEVILDASMDSEILREIPLLGSIIGFSRAAIAVRDRLFLNKLRYFLQEIERMPAKERQKMIEEINESTENEIKVGEKILYIVDRCDDHMKSKLAGKLFRHMLEGTLLYQDFLSLSAVLDKFSARDALEFANSLWERVSVEELGPHLLGTSLVEIWQHQIEVSDQDDWKRSERYKVEGGVLTASISPLGRKFRAALGDSPGT